MHDSIRLEPLCKTIFAAALLGRLIKIGRDAGSFFVGLQILDYYQTKDSVQRSQNKVPACRCIVITNSKEPLEFFYYCKQIGGDRSEALDQFMWRIQSTVQVIKADDWTTPEYRISDGQRTGERLLPVPGSGGVQVRLLYGFRAEQSMGEDEALEYLLGKVEENSDLVAKLQDEVEAAALEAAEKLEQFELEGLGGW